MSVLTASAAYAAIREAGWTAEALASALKCDKADAQAYLDTGMSLPREASDRMQAWLTHHVGQGANGLLYVDPYRPPMTLAGVVDHPVVQVSR